MVTSILFVKAISNPKSPVAIFIIVEPYFGLHADSCAFICINFPKVDNYFVVDVRSVKVNDGRIGEKCRNRHVTKKRF